jgi:hypothetical protein
LLVVALVVIPLMIGLILLGRKVITMYLNQVAMMEQPLARPVVWDSSGTAKPVGPVIGYDGFEAPTVSVQGSHYDHGSPGVSSRRAFCSVCGRGVSPPYRGLTTTRPIVQARRT